MRPWAPRWLCGRFFAQNRHRLPARQFSSRPALRSGCSRRAPLGLIRLFVPTAGLLPYAATFLIGVAKGAQLDVIPYMVSRYFGLTAFAEIYGYLFAVFTLGGVVGPMLMGKALTL
jgi:hypothetical protein